MIAVDQDPLGKQAGIVNSQNGLWALAKPLANGDVSIALFNSTNSPATIATTASAAGLGPATGYNLRDLWTHQSTETAGAISAVVPPHATVMYRVSPVDNPTQAPPNVMLNVAGLSLTGGQPATATETFTDNGVLPAQNVQLGLSAPDGWTVEATSPTSFGAVESGQTVQAMFRVLAPVPQQLFETDAVTATADYKWHGTNPASTSQTQNVTTSPPVQAPYRTFASATDAPVRFAQSGQQLGVNGAGSSLSSSGDAYSSIYLPGAVGTSATVDTTVSAQSNLTGSGSAGIIVRNDMTASGTGPEGVVLAESPANGVQLSWTSSGGTHVDSVTPANNKIPTILPIHLRLQRTSASTYTGYYSFDGTSWIAVGSATVPGQTDTQDTGVFVTSHASGAPATVTFDGLAVADGATPPPAAQSFEAEAATNTIGGQARISSCTACSGGQKIGFIGKSGTLTFNGINAPADGDYSVAIAYLNGPPSRQAIVTANGADPQTLTFAVTTDFNTLGVMVISVHLIAGANTIEFANPSANAPDIDRILVAQEAS